MLNLYANIQCKLVSMRSYRIHLFNCQLEYNMTPPVVPSLEDVVIKYIEKKILTLTSLCPCVREDFLALCQIPVLKENIIIW